MKLKLLLIALVFTSGALFAQDTIRSLVITEANLHPEPQAYLELTNMGNEPIQLSNFKLGLIEHDVVPWNVRAGRLYRLPEKVLLPGESFVIASATDFQAEQFAKGVDGYAEKLTNDRMYEVADMLVHIGELNGDETDSITPGWSGIFGRIVHGRQVPFIQQMLSETDSVVIDQVGGVFDEPDGTNITFGDAGLAGYDVAGLEGATKYAYLVRRFNVKQGNLDFANTKGVGLDDSEWIPIPRIGGAWRDIPWTVGNHGDYNLDETTLESDVFDIDFANKTITVPWGTRRGDDIMHNMVEKPGIGWIYEMSPAKEDSLSFAASTGDKITIYVCGNDLDKETFDIIVSDPKPSANIVVPMSNEDPLGNWRGNNDADISDVEAGILDWPRVTQNESGIDTIWGAMGGIPYATRIDSLLKRLDKPEKASWEIVYSGMPKPDLTKGDKLKVTAENGDIKEYYVSVKCYRPTHNAYLSAITWPDIPDFYRGIFGWIGDTIPSFNPTITNYKVQVPIDVDGIPAMVGTAEDINAKVAVDRAKNINGSPADRTITFTVTAEDDTTINNYSVELIKEKDPSKLQPYFADPFISEIVFGDMWRGQYGEVCNPGNQMLDMSNYMIAMGYINDPAAMIATTNQDNWRFRYVKYIPGYKWQKEANWATQPYVAEQDLNVNPVLVPGDVFCFGYINADQQAFLEYGNDWPLAKNLDVQFNNFKNGNRTYNNPWGEAVAKGGTCIDQWSGANIFLYKILNDSIKSGLKPATDPYDFELVDVFGMGDGTDWIVAGKSVPQVTTCIRKPEIYKGEPVFARSFGTNEDDSEWINRGMDYWTLQGIPWRRSLVSISSGIGSHYMLEPTNYKSTVSSIIYKVSDGYSNKESIRGLVTGVTVSEFYSGIIKANENQSLNVKSVTNGNILSMDDAISLNDTLIVLSADSLNTTKYILEVTDEGLSSDAVLTSNRYDIVIENNPKSTSDNHKGSGQIIGIEYGTSLKTIIANITVPAGATMDIVNESGAYIPLKMLNFDTVYVNVTVDDKTYLDVTAENGVTSILYRIVPDASENDAFVTSVLYNVKQKEQLIEFVPRGVNVQTFLNNLVASGGASIKLVDNLGNERMDGMVADDDKIAVTSPNGEQNKVYFISKLPTLYVPETSYLAYILSNKYNVNQLVYMIDGVDGNASVNEVYSAISVAPGATAVVVDENGIIKETGTIKRSDLVRVTSADGKIVIFYSFGTLTKINNSILPDIGIYPNPTQGVLNIDGISPGNRIRIFNSVGNLIKDINTTGSIETVNLHNQPSGMYLILVSSGNNILGQFKAIKK